MSWQIYEVAWRLRSPMHIGCGKVGNLQRTRAYVHGRVFWGALTMRLTRDQGISGQPMTDSQQYRQTGELIHNTLAFTYFYPAIKKEGQFNIIWPWQEDFAADYLSSYASTALVYPQQAAEEGSLHEMECLTPYTREGQPLYLYGYILAKESVAFDWKAALRRLQFGGDRCYGWGKVKLIKCENISGTEELFNGAVRIDYEADEKPCIIVGADGALLAHALPDNLAARGDIEVLVGREWRSDQVADNYSGQHVEFTGVFFRPGTLVSNEQKFLVGRFGIWKKIG